MLRVLSMHTAHGPYCNLVLRDRQVTKSYYALVDHHRIDLSLQRDQERPPSVRVSKPGSEQVAVQVVQDLQHLGYKSLCNARQR